MKNTIKSSKSSKTLFTRGFTLIEMLVVIAIIAILSGIIIANLSGAKGKARDAKRVSDLGNIQMALELYFDRCNQYPQPTSGNGSAIGNGGTGQCAKKNTNTNTEYVMTDFIASIPKPTPEVAGHTFYEYGTNGTYTDYVIHSSLESPNAAVVDGLNGTYYGQTCSNVSGTSKDFCLGPK
jgi:prepilin-type N-terminal cleavage/methylation domain-containing protein